MKFGVNLPNYGPDATPDNLVTWTGRIEKAGYHYAMVSDHVALTPEVNQLFPAPFYDPFMTLALLAGVTDRIGLGTTVAILPYRHPVHTARMAANIDRFSNGRLVFGAAAGWAAREFAVLNVPYRKRGAISDEYLAAIKTCWASEVASFDGAHVSFREVHTGPLPVQRPGPPVWVGGHSLGALRRAVRYSDAWHPTSVSGDWLLGIGMPALRQVAEAEGRPVPALCPRIKLRITERALGPRRLLGEGTLQQIRDDLGLLQELGAGAVVLDPLSLGERREKGRTDRDVADLEMLAENIIDLDAGCVR
ncbi:TIGR03619 family F420-dependent LLM class oxidoreductase [Actinacidiphila sp. ITFR-21]|uniref:TIGR03619 family F420-dependent LLM class oxidoreductase n=1 Tax=Actinacidiphila sp. ITFR-21 TaxID=3075199 RepID=UPI00288C0445|nr:TIGR03619 family F420-dependent LLM class oxidoreductase [Streptomyces sp. ITFR-21]WNI14305.1 TIGR03619 family F420-dependent LLM class oxidoreductase [Streptomyces sp. ITFR-21]